MTLVKSFSTWFILWTWIYLCNIKLASEILSKKCINYNTNKFKKLSLLYSLINIFFIFILFKKKVYLAMDKVIIDIINISMLSIASILDLMIREVETCFLRFILLASIVFTRKASIVSSSLSAFMIYMILYSVYQVTRGSIGGADIRILTILAFGYGFSGSMLILTYAAWACLICTLLAYTFKRININQEIAFVPYIYLAYIFLLYNYKI